MSTSTLNFILIERGIIRSRRIAYAGSAALLAIITVTAAVMLTTLMRNRFGMDVNGKILVVALIFMVVALWGTCVAAILLATVRNRKWFAKFSGTISLAEDSLHIGNLSIKQSSIVSSEKTRRHLRIRYRRDGKPCQVALPLRWLPVGASNEILRRIKNNSAHPTSL